MAQGTMTATYEYDYNSKHYYTTDTINVIDSEVAPVSSAKITLSPNPLYLTVGSHLVSAHIEHGETSGDKSTVRISIPTWLQHQPYVTVQSVVSDSEATPEVKYQGGMLSIDYPDDHTVEAGDELMITFQLICD